MGPKQDLKYYLVIYIWGGFQSTCFDLYVRVHLEVFSINYRLPRNTRQNKGNSWKFSKPVWGLSSKHQSERIIIVCQRNPLQTCNCKIT